MIESRKLLKLVTRQSDILERMERESPGITKVSRDAQGSIILNETNTDFNSLIQLIQTEISRCEKFHQKTIN